jgi:fructuronate reductase
MTRLSRATLAQLPEGVARPEYDLDAVRPGVVHFGPGAFHRAHQAAAFDRLLARDPRWGITGISLNSTDVADALTPQDGLYTLMLLDEEPDLQVIGAIGRVRTAREEGAVIAALASADTRLVTATVTEKGYCLNGDGALDPQHPAIQHDLSGDGPPRSFIGWLVAGLAVRRTAGQGGLTVLSCDNLAENGRKLGDAVRAFAGERDPDTARWIEQEVRFPNTMVDSITPATDDAVRRRVSVTIGMEDVWPIQRERFTQWVIEDDFTGERPPLDLVGVTFARDVKGYETAKLRLLNGAHSTLAYLGLALGHETVAQAMVDGDLARFAERLMREDIAPSLRAPEGLNLEDYIGAILQRFRNPAIQHRLSQIAWDGSQKLPYRLLDTTAAAIRAGRPVDRLAVPVAAWMHFISRRAAEGAAITDPLAGPLVDAARGASPTQLAERLFAFDAIFRPEIAGHDGFRAAAIDAVRALSEGRVETLLAR